MTKKKQIFIEGSITPQFIADCIQKHQTKTEIGAHNIFLGQVRKDKTAEASVVAIEFSAYKEMAEKVVYEIREDAFEKFDLSCLHIYHSLGKVETGEICFFVFVSAAHRNQVFDATSYLVDRVKQDVPIFGKEIFDNETFKWKENIVHG